MSYDFTKGYRYRGFTVTEERNWPAWKGATAWIASNQKPAGIYRPLRLRRVGHRDRELLMDDAYALAWLKKRSWHVTDLRVEAIMAGVDLTVLGCELWSDGGPCQTCVRVGLEDTKRTVN